MNDVIEYNNTDDAFKDICSIIDNAQKYAYQVVNHTLVIRNWIIGRRVAEEILKGDNRAQYGAEVIGNLSKKLTARYGKGFYFTKHLQVS